MISVVEVLEVEVVGIEFDAVITPYSQLEWQSPSMHTSFSSATHSAVHFATETENFRKDPCACVQSVLV